MFPSFPYNEVASRIALALGTGLLVGLEREWAQKEVGVRTFAIIALFGALTVLAAQQLMVAALAGTLLLVAFLNIQSLIKDGSLEMTTSAALLVMFMVGALIGEGHYFTAITSSIVMTMLLAWKAGLARFAGALQPEEIRSAVLLGLLTFVIYPLLPNLFVDPWQLFNPRQEWVIVVVIAGLGFVNYVMLRMYGPRGTYYAAFLGGLVNSTAAAAELAKVFRGVDNSVSLGVAVLMLTSLAMFIRNLLILAIFAPASLATALLPLAVMTAGSLALVVMRRDHGDASIPQLQMSSPVSVPYVIKFAVLFVAMTAIGTLAQRHLGSLGFLGLSVLGGLVSSASTTATAATLASTGKISWETAGIAVVLTSMTSALVNLPIVYQQTRETALVRRLAFTSALVVLSGLVFLGVSDMEKQTFQRFTFDALRTVQSR
ncbi:MAG TPA: DUF4010 domain-containing protein [Candidatus Acidoferrales bacterium]|nr:DUF4010 domain-containing protein [Candidatus Acidoferrales bacterium]